MADDGKLYIIISDKRDDDGNGGNTPADTTQKDSNKKSSQSIITHQFYNFITSQAKQFVNYNIQNIGNFSGDYITQRRVNEAIQGLNITMNIGGAFISGTMMTGNPLVGAAFATIAIAGTAINAMYQSHTQRIQNAKTNYNIDQLRRRSGLNTYIDGSRGTEN